MAKAKAKMKTSEFDVMREQFIEQVSGAFDGLVGRIVTVVQQQMVTGLANALGGTVPGLTPAPAAPLQLATATGKPQTAAKKTGGGARVFPTSCKVPGCNQPHKGPRFHFLCATHREFPKYKLKELMKEAAA